MNNLFNKQLCTYRFLKIHWVLAIETMKQIIEEVHNIVHLNRKIVFYKSFIA